MKMVMAIVQDEDADRVLDDLIATGYRATKIASSGGFLRRGNSVLMIGVDDPLVDDVIETLRRRCRRRQQLVEPSALPILRQSPPAPLEVAVGGATVFVWDVERYVRL